MNTNSCWEVLDLRATRDQREIRRAYAARLKTIDQATQAEDFKQLRLAYETALQLAQQGTQTQPPAPQPTDETQPPSQVPPAAAAHSQTNPAEVVDRNLEDMRAAFTALEASLHSQVFDPATSVERLQELLRLPGWERLELANSCEAALADLIVRNAPRSDALVPICIDRFSWHEDDRRYRANPAVRALLQHYNDVQFLQRLRAGDNELADAYQRLTEPGPSGLCKLRSWWSGALRTDEIKLLSLLTDEHPNIIGSLDRGHVAWWRKFRTQTQLPYLTTRIALGAAGLLILYILLSASGMLSQLDTWHLSATSAGIAAVGLLALIPLQWGLIELPTEWVLRRWSGRAPQILALGWLPALLLLMGMDIALAVSYQNPNNTLLLAVTVPLAALGTLWATWAAGPKPVFEWSEHNWLESSRLAQIIVANCPAFVLLWWIITPRSLNDVPAYAVAATAALVAPTLGITPITRFWDGRVKPLLRIFLIGLTMLIAAAEIPLIVMYNDDHQSYRGLRDFHSYHGFNGYGDDGSLVLSTPVIIGAIVACLVLQHIVTSRIVWKRLWPNVWIASVLLFDSTNASPDLASTRSVEFMGILVMGFTCFRLFSALRIEWRARQEGL